MKQIKPTAGPITKVWIAGSDSGGLSDTSITTTAKFTPIGDHISNSSLSSAATLTPQSDANAIMFSPDSQSVKMRMDGGVATASVGFTFAAGDVVTIQFTDGVTFSFIELAASATLQYQWGKIE